MLLTEQRKQPEAGYLPNAEAFEQALADGLHPEGYFVTAYEICLEDGILQSYHRFADIEEAVKAQNAGSHELVVRVYGNRFNVMGALHNADGYSVGFGSDAYHTTGEQWTDIYRVRPVGLLAAPQLERREN